MILRIQTYKATSRDDAVRKKLKAERGMQCEKWMWRQPPLGSRDFRPSPGGAINPRASSGMPSGSGIKYVAVVDAITAGKGFHAHLLHTEAIEPLPRCWADSERAGVAVCAGHSTRREPIGGTEGG